MKREVESLDGDVGDQCSDLTAQHRALRILVG